MKPRRISVRGIIYKDGKLLCVRHKFADGSPRPVYATPGGGLEENESLIEGVTREMIEETGIVPKVGKLLFIQQFVLASGVEEVDFLFHIENPEDYAEIDLTTTTHGEVELAEIGFVDPHTSPILPTFLTELDIEAQIASNQPPLIVNNLHEAPHA